MSVATEISRLTAVRDGIRTKLNSLTIVSSETATLNDCKEALNEVSLRARKDISTIDGTTTVPVGYYNQPTSFEAPAGVQYYYKGTTAPASSLGSDGDLYFMS